MRSSPSCWVVSRSGSREEPFPFLHPPEGGVNNVSGSSRDGRIDMNDDGLTIYLKIDYKVLLLVLVILDIVHTSLSEIVAHYVGL
jgi:hypothetical protein